MKRTASLWIGSLAVCMGLLAAAESAMARPADEAIASRTAMVGGVKLHYLTAGHGPAVLLLHGYTQTSRMWRPIIPLLAQKPSLPRICPELATRTFPMPAWT